MRLELNEENKNGQSQEMYSVVDEKRTEKEKWMSMDKKQKKEYFLEYYAPKLLYVLIIVVIIVFLVVRFFTSDSAVMNVFAVNTSHSGDEANGSDYYSGFLKENGFDTKKDYVSVSSGLGVTPDPNDSASVQSLQMIQSRFMTCSVDVFFSDEDLLVSLGEFGYMEDLRNIFTESFLMEHSDSIIYVKVLETEENIPVGIRLEDNKWIEATGWYDETAVVGIGENAENEDLAVKFIEYILK